MYFRYCIEYYSGLQTYAAKHPPLIVNCIVAQFIRQPKAVFHSFLLVQCTYICQVAKFSF
jgi:hypothetical protein